MTKLGYCTTCVLVLAGSSQVLRLQIRIKILYTTEQLANQDTTKEKAKEASYFCLEPPSRRLKKRQSQALFRGSQGKDEMQQIQVARQETSQRYKKKNCSP